MRTATLPRRDRHGPPCRAVMRALPSRTLRTTVLAIFFAVLIALGFAPGCSLFHDKVWSPGDSLNVLTGESHRVRKGGSDTPLKHQRTSTLTHTSQDTISLAVDFRHVPSSALGDAMWRSIDETAFDARIRQAWLANGLRIGLLFGSGEAAVDNAISPDHMTDAVNELFAGAETLGGQPDGCEVVPLRPSRRHELPIGQALPGTQTLLLNQTGGVIGMGVENPQFLLALTAENGPRHGQSTLRIRPEIQHGSMRQKFVTSDNAVRIQTGRDRWPLGELDLTWVTHPGSILVIAPVIQADEAETTFGLGRQILRDPDHLIDDQHIVTFLQVEK